MDPRPGHPYLALRFTDAGRADDRPCRGREGGGRQRDMSFAGQQAGGGVHADPAGTGDIGLAPGMEIDETVSRKGMSAAARVSG